MLCCETHGRDVEVDDDDEVGAPGVAQRCRVAQQVRQLEAAVTQRRHETDRRLFSHHRPDPAAFPAAAPAAAAAGSRAEVERLDDDAWVGLGPLP